MGKVTKTPDKNSPEYWEKVLAADGLSMNAGLDPGHRKLLRVGGIADLERIHAVKTTDAGRVRPKGASSDTDS